MNLKGTRALITGGSEGIGRGIAEAFLAKGAEVAIMSRSLKRLQAAAQETGALAIQGDVGVEADAVRAVETTVRELGGLDVLVNNAGFGVFLPLVEMDLDAFESVFRTNVVGAMLMAREAAGHFVKQGRGHIVNISSTSGLKGGRGSTAYSGSKFALKGMTECWRDELRRHNIRVVLVNPSEVQTDFMGKVGGSRELSDKKLRPKEIADAVVGALEIDDRGFIPEFSVFATNPF
jgi:3-oxoacyl-[acyl-carrier protein] reductase